MTNHLTRALLLVAVLAAAPASALAQPMPRPDPTAASRALTQEVLEIFRTICLASAANDEPVPAIVERVLGATATALPADRLRANEQVRETGGWMVTGQQGRYRLNTIEPGSQCGLVAEGVDHDAYLEGTMQVIAQAGTRTPGWVPAGAPRRQSAARPFGTLTFVTANLAVTATPPRLLTITGSAAARTDGRPNTGVITLSLRDAVR